MRAHTYLPLWTTIEQQENEDGIVVTTKAWGGRDCGCRVSQVGQMCTLICCLVWWGEAAQPRMPSSPGHGLNSPLVRAPRTRLWIYHHVFLTAKSPSQKLFFSGGGNSKHHPMSTFIKSVGKQGTIYERCACRYQPVISTRESTWSPHNAYGKSNPSSFHHTPLLAENTPLTSFR